MSSTAEHLTTGWEPSVDADDTVLRRYLFHWAATAEAFSVAGGGRAMRTPQVAASDLGRPSGYFNAAVLLQPLPHTDGTDAWVEVIDQIEQFYAPGAGSYDLWSAWPTPDLRARGWELVGHPPLLVRPPAQLLPPPAVAPLGPEFEIRRVDDVESLRHWERVAVEGYPLTELQPVEAGALVDARILADDRVEAWVGYRAGQPVSIGTMFHEADLASFTLGVTLPSARGQGLWRRHAIDRLGAAPDRWVAGVFSDDSRPGAQSLGFLPINRFTLWTKTR